MLVLRLFFLVLFLGKQCLCLNVTNHGNDIDKLKEIVQQLNASLQHMQTEQIRKDVLFRSEIEQLRNETTHLKANLYSQSHGTIAFTARLSRDVNLAQGQTVVFDKTQLNIGNAYHETYGHFNAPIAGLYQFALTLLNDGNESYFSLVRNGNELLAALYSKAGFIPASAVVVVQLEASDVVFVKATNVGANLDEPFYCLFSGYLIQ
eukprot:XP_011449651.1 PREDICTED: complement C1q-like protein 4 [Crassostrea gigas]